MNIYHAQKQPSAKQIFFQVTTKAQVLSDFPLMARFCLLNTKQIWSNSSQLWWQNEFICYYLNILLGQYMQKIKFLAS